MARPVGIELDKPRRLRFTFNSVADVEAVAGQGVIALFSEGQIGFHVLRLLTWGGLKWEDPKLTIQKAGKLLGAFLEENPEDGWDTLIDKLTEALEESKIIPKKRAIDEDDEDAEGNGAEEPETGESQIPGSSIPS